MPALARPSRDAFDALGDPTRRAIFERLAAGPKSVGEAAHGLTVSRPAVSQHLKVLREAGLVTESADGARRIYRVDPRGVGRVREMLDAWHAAALASFKAFADAEFNEEEQEAE